MGLRTIEEVARKRPTMSEKLKNWARNLTYGAKRIHHPTDAEQVAALIVGSRKVRVVGTRHSFNSIADTNEDLISLALLDRVVRLDDDRRQVEVEAGIPYGRLAVYLQEKGFAVPNLASLPHISVGGAVATATHGSGERNGSLAYPVAALELVRADGSTVRFSRGDADFEGAVVHLGALGAVTRLTLDLEPAFDVRQYVYERLPFDEATANFDAIESSAYSVSLFTRWNSDHVDQVWLKCREGQGDFGPSFFGAMPAPEDRHPIPGISAVNCTPQMGLEGPWFERLPHFRMDFTPSSGEELQSEYLVPRENAVEALKRVNEIRHRVAPLVQTSEIRAIAADDLWMSPFCRQPCIGVHFTWVKDWEAVRALLPEIEARLLPLGARPHWGKLFLAETGQIAPLYPRLEDFRELVRRHDPEGKFRNEFLSRHVFG